MSDWHNEVVKLGKIEPLPNSDFLEITTVMGVYPCILKKGEYKENDLVSFIQYDTIVPDIELFAFLAPPPKKDLQGNILIPSPKVGEIPEKYRRIKAKKIRKTYSEGLIVPAPEGFVEGQSIVEHFGLKKYVYEEELDDLPAKTKTTNSEHEKNPKTFQLFKYDLEGMAKYGYAFEDGEEVLISEKIEGCSISFTYAEDRLWVRSRNYFKRNGFKRPPARTLSQQVKYLWQDIKEFFIKPKNNIALNEWWDFPIRVGLEQKLKQYPYMSILGELYGKVKHFDYDTQIVDGRRIQNFRVFDIWDIKSKKFLEWEEVEKISKQLELTTAPILYKGPWKTDKSLYLLAEGKSTFGNHVREGFVLRSIPEKYCPQLGRKIIKLKGQDYKLFKN